MTKSMLAKLILFSSLLIGVTWISPQRSIRAGDLPAPSEQPSQQIDPNFLLLPAYDLQWVNQPTAVRVGDTLSAQIAKNVKNGAQLPEGLKTKLPSGTENADELPFTWSDNVASAQDGALQIQVTAIKPGEVSLPALTLVDSSGKAVARTNPLQLSVASAISSNDPKPKQPEPPRPPVSLSFPMATLIVLGFLALGVIAALIFWLVRWSRGRKALPKAEIPKPVLPEDEVALAKLAQLEKKGLLRAGQYKAHYFAVSEIIKHYIGERYGFDAAESTTFEMISYLEEKHGAFGSVDLIDMLKDMFDRLDRVKFTDHVPVAIEGTELLEEARKLVIKTRRPPPMAGIQNSHTQEMSGASR